MNQHLQRNDEDADITSWKAYTKTILGVFFVFALGTFSMAVYFTHLDGASVILSALLVVLYLGVIGMCIRKLVLTLSPAALMLLVPIAPLAILLLVVALLPIVQMLR